MQEIRTKLTELKQLLSVQFDGEIDLSPCNASAEERRSLAYGGTGLAGLERGIDVLFTAVQELHENTRCPVDGNAALPMLWEIKPGAVKQLCVLWKPSDGGNSRWAMSIPHPHINISRATKFDFPPYRKGPNMATMVLKDNTKVILNVASKGEASKVLAYVYSLIDAAYRPSGIDFTYSENVSTAKDVRVSACYVKKFPSHKTSVPDWAVTL